MPIILQHSIGTVAALLSHHLFVSGGACRYDVKDLNPMRFVSRIILLNGFAFDSAAGLIANCQTKESIRDDTPENDGGDPLLMILTFASAQLIIP